MKHAKNVNTRNGKHVNTRNVFNAKTYGFFKNMNGQIGVEDIYVLSFYPPAIAKNTILRRK